jgi:hypothetical protein
MLSVITLSVSMLSVVTLSVIMLSVVILIVTAPTDPIGSLLLSNKRVEGPML